MIDADLEKRDKALIVQMLLEHEMRLKEVEAELRRVREYLTDIDALREQLSDWVMMAKDGGEGGGRLASEARVDGGNIAAIRRLLRNLRAMDYGRKRDLDDER